MHGEERRRHKGGECSFPELQDELKQKRNVQHVQQDTRHMETEGTGAPHGSIDGVREVDDGAGDRAEDDRANVRHIGDRRVLDHRVVVVVHERVVEGVQVDEAAEQHRGATGGKPAVVM